MPNRRSGPRRAANWVVGAAVLLLVVVYVTSGVLYVRDLDSTYDPPTPTPDGLAVAMVPFAIDTQTQGADTEVLIYPGADLLSPDQRLVRDITIDIFAAESKTVTFAKGTVPAPVQVNIPALGVVQRYPFDTYRYSVGVRAATGQPKARISTTIPTQLTVFFDLAGWDYEPVISNSTFAGGQRLATGVFYRDGSTRTIAVTFILLILMFGVLAVVVVIAGLRQRMPFVIGTAAWLTGALFALVTLRNGLPGNPPLGSVMDVLVYFWVIAVIMVAIGVSVVTLVVRSTESDTVQTPSDPPGASDPPPVTGANPPRPPLPGPQEASPGPR